MTPIPPCMWAIQPSFLIEWFWLPIFRTNLVRGPSNKEMKFQNTGAVLVQIAPLFIEIAPLFISQPRNQNQSIYVL